ncbi:MAG: hypothetical protein GTO18_11845 [Anaerolineales bacterium]|nr:hypothetical protein [Anaerolineales bacterium]
MKKYRWQLIIAIGGLILILGYLLGQSPLVESTESEPVAGGTYREALIGMVSRLNPILITDNQVDRDINRILYRGLVAFDTRRIPRPDLAESWAISADATLYTFTLRDDAIWHDGEPLRSEDVLYTFSKFRDPDYPGPSDLQAFWEEINIIQLDERTVQFQLPEPYAPFLDFVTVGLLPEHLLRGVSAGELIDHPFNLQPVGTGPFKFDHFILEEDSINGVSLSAFQDYFKDRPYLDQVELLFYSDEGRALQAYIDGDVHGIGQVNEGLLDRVLELPNLNLHTAHLPSISTVFLNLKHSEKTFIADKEFRQALLLGVNIQWIIDEVLSGQGVIATGPIFPGTWAYLDSLTPSTFSPAQAEELLVKLGWEIPEGAQAGTSEYVRYKDDTPLVFDLIHASDPLHTAIAEALQESWAHIGVQVSLMPVPASELVTDYLEPRNFESILTDLHIGPYPDPDPYPFWHDSQTETGQNYSGFEDRNIGIWLEKARTTADLTTRADLYKSFQFRFRDQVPAILLYFPVHSYAIDDQVQDVSIGPLLDPSERFADIHLWHMAFQP